jgi:hypothetical protein
MPPPRWFVRGGSVLAAAAGALLGFGFGDQLAGPLVGLVTAANMALVCALLAGSVLERVPWRRR